MYYVCYWQECSWPILAVNRFAEQNYFFVWSEKEQNIIIVNLSNFIFCGKSVIFAAVIFFYQWLMTLIKIGKFKIHKNGMRFGAANMRYGHDYMHVARQLGDFI